MELDFVKQSFSEIFGSRNFNCLSCPGRINIIGEHTDYNHGLVMPAAVNKYLHFCYNRSQSNQFQFYAININELASEGDKEGPAWLTFFRYVLDECRERNFSIIPLNIGFGGNLPIGAGMSSSSAITCGFIACLNKANLWNMSASEMVNLAFKAENRTGLGGGIMDQFSIIRGKAGHLMQINCKDLSHEFIPIHLEEETFLLINSKVSHTLVDSAYTERKNDCLDILKGVQTLYPKIKTVSEITAKMLLGFKIDQTKLKRVHHVISENQRVLDVSYALKHNKIKEIGPLLSQSHQSLKNQYEISCEEIDFILREAESIDGFLGGRIMGGGFGGCCICLIKKDQQASIEKLLFDSYAKNYNLELAFYPVEIVSGVFES